MQRTTLRVTLLILAAVLMLSACDGAAGRAESDSTLASAMVDEQNISWPLPAPSAVMATPSSRAVSALTMVHTGSDFIPTQAQLAVAEGSSARFSPAWLGGTSSFTTVAYALYAFNLQGYTGVHALRLHWGEAPADYTKLWIGLSHWGSDHWDWFAGPASGQLFPPGADFGPYAKSDTGDLLVAVVELGASQVLLDSLRIGNATPDDWSTYGHDARRTHRSPFTGPASPTLKWNYVAGDKIASSPALAPDGTVYFTCSDDFLYALRADGTLRWKFAANISSTTSPAVGADGTIYICGTDGLLAVDADGVLKWSYPVGEYAVNSPVLAPDGTVIFGGRDNLMYAVNPDGTLKWSFAAANWVSTPALDAGGVLYFGSWDHNCYALNPDGTQKWAYSAETFFPSAPAIGADGTVYFSSGDYYLRALSTDGLLLWSYYIEMVYPAAPALGPDGVAYIGASDYGSYQPFAAVNPDGSQKWIYDTVGAVSAAAAIDAQGNIYIGTMDDRMLSINADGALRWTYTTSGAIMSAPAIGADGTIYFGADDCSLYAIGPGLD